MPESVRRVAALSRRSSWPVGLPILVGITFYDATLRIFSWTADCLAPVQIVGGPRNWNPVSPLPGPASRSLYVTSDNQAPDGRWTSSLKLVRRCRVDAARPTFFCSPGSIEPTCNILAGWISRASDSRTQIFAFDNNTRYLKQFEIGQHHILFH